MNQIMAMYQCTNCFHYLKRLLTYLLCFDECDNKNLTSIFSQFSMKVHFNSKKRRRNMENSF